MAFLAAALAFEALAGNPSLESREQNVGVSDAGVRQRVVRVCRNRSVEVIERFL